MGDRCHIRFRFPKTLTKKQKTAAAAILGIDKFDTEVYLDEVNYAGQDIRCGLFTAGIPFACRWGNGDEYLPGGTVCNGVTCVDISADTDGEPIIRANRMKHDLAQIKKFFQLGRKLGLEDK